MLAQELNPNWYKYEALLSEEEVFLWLLLVDKALDEEAHDVRH